MPILREIIFFAACLGTVASSSVFAALSPDGVWSDFSAKANSSGKVEYRSVRANMGGLTEALELAPMEDSNEPAIEFFLPHPDGGFIRLGAYEYSMMAAELQVEFPSIKTYKVHGLDNTYISGRLDIGPRGFHGMLSTDDGRVFIEPETNFNKLAAKDSFRSIKQTSLKDSVNEKSGCQLEGHGQLASILAGKNFTSLPSAKQAGGKKRVYKLAMAGTAEYTAAVSSALPSVAEGQAAIITTVNRINDIFEKEVSIGFELVGNNSSIVFTDTSTDGYSCSEKEKPVAERDASKCPGNDLNIPDSHGTLFNNNLAKLDAVIGNANYDMGHVLSTVGGGLAGLGVVCDSASGTNRKAFGSTGSSNPSGNSFIVDLLAHEIGHQLGASHTFNASGGSGSGACDGNRAGNTGTLGTASAYETGSGSTIMSYSGICGPQNIQSNSDDYFHARSLEQMREVINGELPFGNINGSICGVESDTGNTPPTANAGANYTIPANTPFALTGSATDADAADISSITYTWEQYDLGAATGSLLQMHTDSGSGPLVRSRPGTSSATRYIPALDAILEGNLTKYTGERLPKTDRNMTFRLTVRSGAQGFNQDDTVITVNKDVGPLRVTSPTGGDLFATGADINVLWDVANTTAAPVSCANMKISYSADSGQSFPTVLLASTPNDGSQSVTLPNSTTSQGRIKVQCQNNIFFNVSPSDFTLTSSPLLAISSLSADKVEGDNATSAYTFNVLRSGSAVGSASATYTVSGTGVNAADESDFGGFFPSGTVSFADGESSQIINIGVSGDADVETDESFVITLSAAVNITIGTSVANGIIRDDDAIPTTPIAPVAAVSGGGGGGSFGWFMFAMLMAYVPLRRLR